MKAAGAARCLLLAIASFACARTEGDAAPRAEAPASWPADVVVAVDGWPVTRAELARAAEWAKDYSEHGSVLRHRERVALVNLLLPRAAFAARGGEARDQALERARAVRAGLRPGDAGPRPPAVGPVEHIATGDLDTFGPFALSAALELEVGDWSEPVEGFGEFLLVRRITDPLEGSARMMTIGVIRFPYADAIPAGSFDPGNPLAGARLEFADEAYREIIPLAVQSLMITAPPATQP